MLSGGGKFAMPGEKLFVVGRVSDSVEVASVNGFGLIMLGDSNGLEAILSGRDIDIAAHEVHEIRALKQKLSHPRIVVVRCGNVAVRALLRLCSADGVRNEGAVSLAGKTGRRNGLLRVIEPLPVGVLRADQNRAG